MNIVDKNLQFCIMELSVDISNIERQVFHEGIDVVLAHGNDNLLPRGTLGCYLNLQFQLRSSFNNVVDLFNFPGIESRKYFLDLENVSRRGR